LDQRNDRQTVWQSAVNICAHKIGMERWLSYDQNNRR